MAKRHDISAEYARQLLDYDPETGILTWKARTPDMFKDGMRRDAEQECRRWNSKHAGKVAGGLHPRGYLTIAIEGVRYAQHRICWLIETGNWPKDGLDHKNGIRSNNQFKELREATDAQNQQNQKLRIDSTSGFRGVSWHKKASKWTAYIHIDGNKKYLGLYTDKESAYAAYLLAKSKFHTFQPIPRD